MTIGKNVHSFDKEITIGGVCVVRISSFKKLVLYLYKMFALLYAILLKLRPDASSHEVFDGHDKRIVIEPHLCDIEKGLKTHEVSSSNLVLSLPSILAFIYSKSMYIFT